MLLLPRGILPSLADRLARRGVRPTAPDGGEVVVAP
jgi:hypothetical protein